MSIQNLVVLAFTDFGQKLIQVIQMWQEGFPWASRLSSDAQSLIEGLLHLDVTLRLGAIGGVREISAHPFFRMGEGDGLLDWDTLKEKWVLPAVKPLGENWCQAGEGSMEDDDWL